MATTTPAAAWRRPAVLTYGFRPFFLAGAVQAGLMIGIWVPWFLGFIRVPSAFPPTAWHAHELLFGYVPAIVAGFLLTAIPNWTGRPAIAGAPLAGLFGIWLAGRVAVALSEDLSPLAVALVATAFLAALVLVAGREIIAARDWRDLKIVAGVGVLAAAQVAFHYEVWRFGRAVYGDHLALAVTMMLILIIGGRIVPNFTMNWVKRSNPGPTPAPFSTFDRISMVFAGLALAAWVALPAVPATAPFVGGLLITAGAIHVLRQLRWVPHRTVSQPLVAVLHVGYVFVPVGFVLSGIAALYGMPAGAYGGIHAWGVGAIGVMTLAVMTRASRGHTGRPLKAPPLTVAIYLAIVVAAVSRITAAIVPQHTMVLMPLAGLFWICAFLLFVAAYGPMLLRERIDAAG